MGQYPAVANFFNNVYDRMYYDPLRGVVTQKKVTSPNGIASKLTFAPDVPKQRLISPKTDIFSTPEYEKAYKARWRQAMDAPLAHVLNSGFNVDVKNETKVRTLEGKTMNSGVQGVVDQSFYSVISQRIRQ